MISRLFVQWSLEWIPMICQSPRGPWTRRLWYQHGVFLLQSVGAGKYACDVLTANIFVVFSFELIEYCCALLPKIWQRVELLMGQSDIVILMSSLLKTLRTGIFIRPSSDAWDFASSIAFRIFWVFFRCGSQCLLSPSLSSMMISRLIWSIDELRPSWEIHDTLMNCLI